MSEVSSMCKLCDSGDIAEKSPHTGTYIHRNDRLDKPCTNPRCPQCGEVATFKDASEYFWCGNAHWWKGKPFKLPETLMGGAIICHRPTDLRNRIGAYMVEEKGLHIGDKVDAGKVQDMIEEFVKRALSVAKSQVSDLTKEKESALKRVGVLETALREWLSNRDFVIAAGGKEGPLSQDVIRQFAKMQQRAVDMSEAALKGESHG